MAFLNLGGGFLMGIALHVLASYPAAPPLAVTTVFLGGFATFSTFSSNVVTLLMRKQLPLGVAVIATHAVGALALCAAGLFAAESLLGRGQP